MSNPGLNPYSAPLDRRHAAHLLRRTGFGGNPDGVQALIGTAADEAVDSIVDDAIARLLPEPPVWVDMGLPGRRDPERKKYLDELNPMWLTDYYADIMRQLYEGGLRERMLLFWHNHFVTQIGSYKIAPIAYRYVTALREYALGNFKEFVHAIGLNPAMLLYLNGTQNRVGQPNENFGRELLELFTMGQFDVLGKQNYTQTDIEEIARAFTGWTVEPGDLTVRFVSNRHDFEEKTIMGRTGAWGYNDVVDILFEERGEQIAQFIIRKLYREFVYTTPDEELVEELTQIFKDSGFEIEPVVRALFKSAQFHDEEVMGALVKSPVSMAVGLVSETNATPEGKQFNTLFRIGIHLNQRLLDPPNVAGWEGYHTWINTTTLPSRWLAAEALILQDRAAIPDLNPIGTAESLLASAPGGAVSPNIPASVFPLAILLAEHFMPVPLDTLDLSPPSDGFAGNLELFPIPDDVLNGPPHELYLAQILLQGTFPWYEWRLGAPQAQSILNHYLRFLAQLPEFQLT